MFFSLSKIVWSLAVPSTALAIVFGAGLVLACTRWRRKGVLLLALGALSYMAVILLPVGQLMVAPLENRFPAGPEIAEPVAGIVMLAGPMDSQTTIARGQISLHDGVERYLEFVRLMRRHGTARGIVTGGNPSLMRESAGQAFYGRTLLESIGFDVTRVTFETQARNTHENAVLAKRLADPKAGERWILVTSAFHMPRAVGVFRAQDWDVVPWPVDYRSEGPEGRLFLTTSGGEAVGAVDLAMKEWVGLLAYYLTGKTDELFPAPE